MLIWDINPGYLNRDILLAEHRELHRIVTTVGGRKMDLGYDRDTMLWSGYGWALKQRHKLLTTELELRHYADFTPVMTRSRKDVWPEIGSDDPLIQFQELAERYLDEEPGRIPLPIHSQQLWAQHKYSVLARDQNLYRRLGKKVAAMRRHDDFADLALLLTNTLRRPPAEGDLKNALQHMWGHVSGEEENGAYIINRSPARFLKEIQLRAVESNEPHLMASTALGELMAWIK